MLLIDIRLESPTSMIQDDKSANRVTLFCPTAKYYLEIETSISYLNCEPDKVTKLLDSFDS